MRFNLKSVLIICLLTVKGTFSHAQCDESVREAFGGTAAIALYNTYTTIGVLGDSYEGKIYTSEELVSYMNEQTSMIETIEKMLTIASTSEDLPQDDRIAMKNIIDCLNILKLQAQALSDYGSTGEEKYAEEFQSNRTKAWDMISKFLGIEE